MLLAGCAEPITTVPADDGGPPPLRAALIGACTQGQFTPFSAHLWPCHSQVNFHTGVVALQSSLQSAVNEWNSKIQATGFSGLPTFQTTTDPAGAQATATLTGGTVGPFCGLWSEAALNIFVSAASACGGTASTGGLGSVFLHELGHAVGWTGSSTHRVFRTPAADHCVMHLPEDLTINGSVCVHEVEGVLAGYGLVSYGSNFFATPFVVRSVNSFLPLTLAIGQSATLSPGALVLEPKPGLGGGDDAQVIADDVVPGTENAYFWTTSASTVASVSGGLVTAQSPGTAIISAIPKPGAGYLLAHPFRITGRTATITVPAPPPPAPQILLDEVPVLTAGWHTLSFVGPGSPGPLTWTIDDSRTTTINPDTVLSSAGWSVSVFIEEGSYTLRVATAGIIQDFPVCTGSGGGGGGGGSTDAVEGCASASSEEEEE